MTVNSPFSVRGRRALVVMRDERDISILHRQFGRLGMFVADHDPDDHRLPRIPSTSSCWTPTAFRSRATRVMAWRVDAPVVALIGTEAPSRLKWLLDLQPASFLIKPLRSAGLYTALVVAFDTAQRRLEEAAHIERLEDRIRSRRVVFAAVLHVMRSHALTEEDAFNLIRQTAMRYRITIEQLCADIIAGGGMPNRNSRTA